MDEQLRDMKLDDSLTDEPAEMTEKTAENDENAASKLEAPEKKVNTAEETGEKSADAPAFAELSAKNSESDQNKDNLPLGLKTGPISESVFSGSAGLPRVQRREDDNREFSLILRSHGRAFSQALMTFAGTKQRSGRLWLTFGAMLIVIALLIIQVAYRHRELNLGYELSDAITQREALLEENRKLRIELRVLSRRERLEPLAGHQLGMTVVRPEQIFIVDTKGRLTPSEDSGRRSDGLDNVRRVGEE